MKDNIYHPISGFPINYEEQLEEEKKPYDNMQNQAFQSLPIYTHTEDVVNNPNHYKLFPEMEVIDLIRKTLTTEQFAGYCMGNMLKYKLRAGEKDDVTQDLAKAEKYKEWLYDEH